MTGLGGAAFGALKGVPALGRILTSGGVEALSSKPGERVRSSYGVQERHSAEGLVK